MRAARERIETLQGYGCLAIAVALGATALTIMILSVLHWVTS